MRWYVVVNQDGHGSIDEGKYGCADWDDMGDAMEHAIDCDEKWPQLAPHRVVLVETLVIYRPKKDDVKTITKTKEDFRPTHWPALKRKGGSD